RSTTRRRSRPTCRTSLLRAVRPPAWTPARSSSRMDASMARKSSKRLPAGSSRKRTATRRRAPRPSTKTIRPVQHGARAISRGAPAVTRARGMPGRDTAVLSVRIFDGRRGLIENPNDVFVRILDGDQRQHFAGNLKAAVQGFEVPIFDDAGDSYAVLASKPGW